MLFWQRGALICSSQIAVALCHKPRNFLHHLRVAQSQSQALETCVLRCTLSALAGHQLLKRPPGIALGHSTVHYRPENCYIALSQACRRHIEDS